MTATSEPSAQQAGINHVPGVPEALFRVDDVSCDSALAVSSMRAEPEHWRSGAPSLGSLGVVTTEISVDFCSRSGRAQLRWQHGAAQCTSAPRRTCGGGSVRNDRAGGLLPSPHST